MLLHVCTYCTVLYLPRLLGIVFATDIKLFVAEVILIRPCSSGIIVVILLFAQWLFLVISYRLDDTDIYIAPIVVVVVVVVMIIIVVGGSR